MTKKYRPSSSCEADSFFEKFCFQCAHDAKYQETSHPGDGCEIIALTMGLKVNDPNYPAEWTYDEKGSPVCTKYQHESEPIPYRCSKTEDMFTNEQA